MKSNETMVQQISLQNQKHLTKSQAWPYNILKNTTHYIIKNIPAGGKPR